MNAHVARFIPVLTLLAATSRAAEGTSEGNFIAGPDFPLQPFRRITAVDLDGNLTPEVVVLRGNNLIVYPDPDINDSYVVVAEDALDVDAVRGEGGALLLYTSSAGLKSVGFEDQAYVVRLVDDAALWKGASRVRAAKYPGVIGVAADERTFFSAQLDQAVQAPPLVLFAIGPATRDVRLLEWGPTPDQEIAILTTNGLQLRTHAGAILLARGAPVPGDAIAAVSQQGSTDGLAWVTRTSGGQTLLLLFHESFGGTYQGPIQLGAQTFGSVCSADIDADGDGDLVLARVASGTIAIAENLSAPGTWSAPAPSPAGAFGSGITDTIELGSDEAPSSGQVLCDNFFNDHDAAGAIVPGYALAFPSPSGLRLLPKPGIREGLLPPSADFQGIEFTSARYLAGCSTGSGSPEPHSLWTLFPGDGWGSTTGATHLELIVRESPAPGLSPLQTAIHHAIFPLAPGGIPLTLVSFTGSEIPSSPEDSNRCYFAGVRPVRLNAQATNILEAWRWSVVGVSAHCDGLAWLDSIPFSLDLSVPYGSTWICGDPSGFLPCGELLLTLGGARYIPSGVPLTKFPSSGPGVMPIVYPWSY